MNDQRENTGKPVNKDAIELYNVYIHGDLPRRDFLRKLAGIAGSAAAASVLLPLLERVTTRRSQSWPGNAR